jgi:hypothetical protein
MKTYDLIKETLEDCPETRNSDKKLQWKIWTRLGYVEEGYALQYEDFLRATSPETIRRCRQKIQELHPELQAIRRVRAERKYIENQRGTHIFRTIAGTQDRFI